MDNPPRPLDFAALRAQLAAGEGPAVWRSLEQFAADPQWQALFAREFPPDATTPTPGLERRSFLKLMAASLALAGLTSCTQARQQIAPYTRKPEELVVGNPLVYATAMPFNGYGRGLLVRSNEGRLTKTARSVPGRIYLRSWPSHWPLSRQRVGQSCVCLPKL